MAQQRTRKGATKRRQPLAIKRWLFVFTSVFAVAGFSTGLFWLGIKVSEVSWRPMPVKEVKLNSVLVFQNQQAVNETVNKFIGRSLIMVDLGTVKQELESLPWVMSAQVVKNWPGQLEVIIDEHEPVAWWNETQVLNSEGLPLEQPASDMSLAQLNGPENSAELVMEYYLQFSKIFQGFAINVITVELQARGSWSMQLNNGVEIQLGDQNVLERSRRVLAFLQSEQFSVNELLYIDARYPNGMAVRFKENNLTEVNNDIAA